MGGIEHHGVTAVIAAPCSSSGPSEQLTHAVKELGMDRDHRGSAKKSPVGVGETYGVRRGKCTDFKFCSIVLR
jgi:hypothetical protein